MHSRDGSLSLAEDLKNDVAVTHLKRARVNLQAQQYNVAIDDANLVLKTPHVQDKQKAGAYAVLGDIHMHRGNWEAALASYQQAHQLVPKFRLKIKTAHFQFGKLAPESEKLQHYYKFIAMTPSSEFDYRLIPIHFSLAKIYLSQGNDQIASEHFMKVVRLCKDNAQKEEKDIQILFKTYDALGKLCLLQNQPQQAIDYYTQMVDLYDEKQGKWKTVEKYKTLLCDAHGQLSNLFHSQQQSDKALYHGTYQVFLGGKSTHAEVYYQCGLLSQHHRERGLVASYPIKTELSYYTQAITLDPNHLKAHVKRYKIDFQNFNQNNDEINKANEIRKALVVYFKILELNEKTNDANKADEKLFQPLFSVLQKIDKTMLVNVLYQPPLEESNFLLIKALDKNNLLGQRMWEPTILLTSCSLTSGVLKSILLELHRRNKNISEILSKLGYRNKQINQISKAIITETKKSTQLYTININSGNPSKNTDNDVPITLWADASISFFKTIRNGEQVQAEELGNVSNAALYKNQL